MIKDERSNSVILVGRIVKLAFSHSHFGERYDEITLRVNRTTPGKYDEIPVLLPEMIGKGLKIGNTVMVKGQLRVYKNDISCWQSKRTMVFSRCIQKVFDESEHVNQVVLIGNLERSSFIRQTPLSFKTIIEFVVAVPKHFNPTNCDIIHCIAWQSAAFFVSHLEPCTTIKVTGRIQSRSFSKYQELSIVHEVSCQKIELVPCKSEKFF